MLIDYPWIQHILGPSEKTLPTLAHRMQHYHARPRLWFYSNPSSPTATYHSDSDPEAEAEEEEAALVASGRTTSYRC
jgi:histidinol-phosphate/aromatic aminotransferase/cobyric acid decarboxylase-like protein